MGKNGRKACLWAAAFLLLALHCMGVGVSAYAAPKARKISLSCREMSIGVGRADSLKAVNAKRKGASKDALPMGEENLPKEATRTDPGSGIVESGQWRGMDWRLDSSGKLTISGEYDASVAGGSKWAEGNIAIRSVDIVATNVESTEGWF